MDVRMQWSSSWQRRRILGQMDRPDTFPYMYCCLYPPRIVCPSLLRPTGFLRYFSSMSIRRHKAVANSNCRVLGALVRKLIRPKIASSLEVSSTSSVGSMRMGLTMRLQSFYNSIWTLLAHILQITWLSCSFNPYVRSNNPQRIRIVYELTPANSNN